MSASFWFETSICYQGQKTTPFPKSSSSMWSGHDRNRIISGCTAYRGSVLQMSSDMWMFGLLCCHSVRMQLFLCNTIILRLLLSSSYRFQARKSWTLQLFVFWSWWNLQKRSWMWGSCCWNHYLKQKQQNHIIKWRVSVQACWKQSAKPSTPSWLGSWHNNNMHLKHCHCQNQMTQKWFLLLQILWLLGYSHSWHISATDA